MQDIKIYEDKMNKTLDNLAGEYVSRIEKKALGKLREKFEQGG